MKIFQIIFQTDFVLFCGGSKPPPYRAILSLLDKLEFGEQFYIVRQKAPLQGELASVSETEGFVAKQHNGFCTI